jgi:tRNA (guanine10-N2)-methyltransferase
MDAEIALLMATQALVQPGQLVYDPFVGTGSILIAAAHFGALTMVGVVILLKLCLVRSVGM